MEIKIKQVEFKGNPNCFICKKGNEIILFVRKQAWAANSYIWKYLRKSDGASFELVASDIHRAIEQVALK